MRIGLLHPGDMGVTIGQALLDNGHEVLWASQGRSAATVQRGQAFVDMGHLAAMLASVDAVISICPPHAALAQATAVAQLGFAGHYVDANAISPQTAAAIASLVGDTYVDGGIIGPPALRPGTTRLYLSSAGRHVVAGWFDQGALQAIALDGEACAASALKMAYAAYTKGHSALLLAVNAMAAAAGVNQALLAEWAVSQPQLASQSERTAAATSGKAWRFVGEMQQIAQTFAALGLPDDFHLGAAEVYQRMHQPADAGPANLAEVIEMLQRRR